MSLTSSQGKVLASLHNVLPAIFGSKDSDALHPIPNLKTRDKWWSRGGTAGVNSVLRDNLKKAKKAIYTGITSFIRDPVARVVATECLTLSISFIKVLSLNDFISNSKLMLLILLCVERLLGI